MTQLDELLTEIKQAVTPTLEQADWAEDEIAQAQHRHRDRADLLYHAFGLLRPTAALVRTEWVYRAHCRELLDRLAAGRDTRPATAAELASLCSRISQTVPLSTPAVTVYLRATARLPGHPGPPGLDPGAYEHVAGAEADRLQGEARARLLRPERRLTDITCGGTHHGNPRPDCPYTTTPKETPTMTITTAATSPLDEPRTRSGDRSVYYFWPLAEVTDRVGGHGWAGIELSVHHFRDRKVFSASTHPLTVFDDGMLQTEISMLTAPAWRRSQAVARYSAKAMTAFAETALAEFRAAYTSGAQGVRALFATTTEKD